MRASGIGARREVDAGAIGTSVMDNARHTQIRHPGESRDPSVRERDG
jgi:hypothetical protein